MQQLQLRYQQLQQEQISLHRDAVRLLQEKERGIYTRIQEAAQLRTMVESLAPGNDFISLMAGTLTVRHCPMRPIKVKRYNYSTDIKTLKIIIKIVMIRNSHKNRNSKMK